jgi:hypothetical protein
VNGIAFAAAFALLQRECPSLDEQALRELVLLELRTLSVSGDGMRVEITCTGDVAAVTLTDTRGQTYPIASRVDFARADPGARERLVALATTELVEQADRADHAEQARPQPTPRPVERREPEPAKTGREAAPRTELALLGVGTVLGSPTTLLAGGALSARFTLAGPWAAALDARLEGGATDAESARVSWTSFGGSAALLYVHRFGTVTLGAGAGARAGRLRLEATVDSPDRGRALSGTWLGPMIPLRASFVLARHVALVGTAEAGHVALPVRGNSTDGSSVARAEGPWISLGVGVAALF